MEKLTRVDKDMIQAGLLLYKVKVHKLLKDAENIGDPDIVKEVKQTFLAVENLIGKVQQA